MKDAVIRPRLGPDRMADSNLVREDIGLSRPIITMDYLCPTEEHIKYGEAQHIMEDI